MINTQLEELVFVVMRAYVDTQVAEPELADAFELELRRRLMQKYCSTTQPNTYTYTLRGGETMGTWTSGVITNKKEMLHG